MADYKRMVSYMYEYEKGLKRKNVGYARIEQKSGQIKITLHMQLLGQLDSIFPTYLIQRDDNGLELIYLGDSVLKSQLMDSKHITEESNVMGSGHNFSKVGGILIFLNEDIFYATEWDDKPVVAKEVMEALKPKTASKHIVDSSLDEEKLSDNTKENSLGEELFTNDTASLEDETTISEKLVYKKLDSKNEAEIIKDKEFDKDEITVSETKGETLESFLDIKNSDANDVVENEFLIPKYKLPGGYKYIEAFKNSRSRTDMVQEIIEEALQEETIQDVPVQEDKFNKETIQDKFIREKMFQEELIHNTVIKEYAEKEVEEVKELDDNEDLYENEEFYNNEDGNDEINDNDELDNKKEFDDVKDIDEVDDIEEVDDELNKTAPEQTEDMQNRENPSAARIFEHYPRIYPFEDNEITMCVKIEPKDIGYLPMEAWGLSNNSFLLHGFYCYHHLIFAKIVDRYGCRYMIGVPGIYHSREQFMARMFGFENFKPIRKRELKQGDFGYWYLVLSL